MSRTFSSSFDISALLTSTPVKNPDVDQVAVVLNPEMAVEVAEQFPDAQLAVKVPDAQLVMEVPDPEVAEEAPNPEFNRIILGAEGGGAAEPVPHGAVNLVPPPIRIGGCDLDDPNLVQVVGADQGVPGLLVTNANVTADIQHLFEQLIGFSRHLGDRSALLMRNGVNNGACFFYCTLTLTL